MAHSLRRGVLILAVLVGFTTFISGCGDKLEGKYIGAGGAMNVEFKSGKAILTSLGQSETCDYTVNGNTITIKSKSAGGDIVLTRMQDGSLKGDLVTLTKAAD